ncbi:tRNA-splicing ligase [Thermanaerothrix daxensis]|uniref:tRNA-splicing ligase RtcB n=1 Tax=Thermanaerothrix daxensis TaxID=869279 RepID=A0A0P6YMU2_9CHLR|nr:RtcB family protein [Thermanaerothrix daxensis]KPL84062.1 tRNA-splicing ligase [Thermanaerothrix daxensis]
MVRLQDIRKINDYEWEIPATYREDMRASVRLFVTRRLLEASLEDLSLEQAINAATLPGVVDPVVVMPDMHQGYGFPIGGVAATRVSDGVVSPGAIGYDINCGVRLLASQIPYEQAEPYLDDLATALNRYCPSGVGTEGEYRLSHEELDQVCRLGARWALKRGLASEEDLRRTEEGGCLEDADPTRVSHKAKERGRTQLGTLGAGNHFLEVDLIEQIFDPEAAQAMGLQEGNLALLIHCGSRGFGHQICTDYVQDLQSAVKKYGIRLPDRELVCAPIDSPEGRNYLAAMRAAANYAFCNRQLLAHAARRAFEEVFAGKVRNWHLHQVYDIAHNMGKIETHLVNGKPLKVCVHRKGATRAFGPGFTELPEEYRPLGQPVLVPGSMGTASWVLIGTETSMQRSWGSTCHGAGRVLSRHKAKKEIRGERLRDELERRGIHVRAGSMSGLAEEAPQAYKDVDEVVETVAGAGIARKVARLRPVAVIKG